MHHEPASTTELGGDADLRVLATGAGLALSPADFELLRQAYPLLRSMLDRNRRLVLGAEEPAHVFVPLSFRRGRE